MITSVSLIADLCSRCRSRPVRVYARQLCATCYERFRRSDEWLPLDRTSLCRDPWLRLEEAALRYAKAKQLGWSARGVESAKENLRRAGEAYRRAFRHRRREERAGVAPQAGRAA